MVNNNTGILYMEDCELDVINCMLLTTCTMRKEIVSHAIKDIIVDLEKGHQV